MIALLHHLREPGGGWLQGASCVLKQLCHDEHCGNIGRIAERGNTEVGPVKRRRQSSGLNSQLCTRAMRSGEAVAKCASDD